MLGRSPKKNMRIQLLFLLAVLSSCQEKNARISVADEPAPPESIVGTWESGLIDGEWGESSIVMTFDNEGNVKGSVNFTDSDAIPWQGTYTLDNGILFRTIEGKTEEIAYSIDGASMHQTIGEEQYTFKKKANKPALDNP
jgi:hypothetical protein